MAEGNLPEMHPKPIPKPNLKFIVLYCKDEEFLSH